MEQRAISSDLIRGHIDTIILHTLLNEDKFAQKIADTIDEKSNSEYKINQATLYSSLKRLESLNYVKSYWNDSPEGRRKFFKITDLGKKLVEDNLSSWSFSRAIIDKLMDCQPERVVTIVQSPKIDQVSPVNQTQLQPMSLQNLPNETIEPAKTIEKPQPEIKENAQEINFRTILNGLIKVKNNTENSVKELEPIQRQNEKINFTETISSEVSPKAHISGGRIDFSDLSLKAVKEGYKLRVSSKDTVLKGKVFINKVNLSAALIVMMLCFIEILIISLCYAPNANFSTAKIIVACCVSIIYPLIALTRCLKEPLKKIVKLSADSILIVGIIVFNLLLIIFAGNLLLDVDFSNLTVTMYSIYIPVLVLLDIFVIFVARYNLAKLRKFCISEKR